MTESLLRGLLQATLVLSAVLVLLALLRPALRALGGATAVYLSWLAVPVALAALWLPAPPFPVALVPGEAVRTVSDARYVVDRMPAFTKDLVPSADAGPLALATLWLTGVGVIAAGLLGSQRRWQRRMKHTAEGLPAVMPAGESPGVVGLLWPRIVLPEDFQLRFSPTEQRLILAHEAVHVRRRDNAWSLLALAIAALNWFNPLAWWALKRLRCDQEMACDELALRHCDTPDREAYQQALLKAHQLLPAPALACPWRSRHPLVERVANLPHADLARGRRKAAQLFAIAASLTLAGAVYATHSGGVSLRTGQDDASGQAVAVRQLRTRTQIDGGQWTEDVTPLPRNASMITAKEYERDGKQFFEMTVMINPPGSRRGSSASLTDPATQALLLPEVAIEYGKPVRLSATTSAGHLIRAEFELTELKPVEKRQP